MTAVKICGVTSLEDAIIAEEAGARYVGMILGGSGRAVKAEMVVETARVLSRSSAVVVITSKEDLEIYRGKLDPVKIFQLHYSYSVSDIELLSENGYRAIPAIILGRDGLKAIDDLVAPLRILRSSIEYVLFDAPKDAKPIDSSGLKVPVDAYLEACRSYRPCGVAGGITLSNAANLKTVRPDVIDVSSGVESSFGKKDPFLVRKLIEIAGVI